MCGLVGVAGQLEAKDEQLIKRLLVFDTPRGLDATGFARKSAHTKDVEICKIASHPFDLFGMTAFTKALSGYNSSVFLGHNRAATTGAKTSYNAHPFQFGKIVGAHNGTLGNTSWKLLEEKIGESFDVDSAAVFAAIDKLGIDETIGLLEEGATGATGAWAFVWINVEDNTLNFIRNKHRPLWYAYTKDFKKIIWASEYKMIDAAISMGSYDLFRTEQGHCFFSVKEDTLYTYDLTELRAGSTTRPKAQVKELKGRAPTPVAKTVTPPFTMGTSQGTTPTHSSAFSESVLHLSNPESDPLRHIMSVERFNDIAATGCCMCDSLVKVTDTSYTVFVDEELVMCGSCSGNGGIRVYTPPVPFFETRKKSLATA